MADLRMKFENQGLRAISRAGPVRRLFVTVRDKEDGHVVAFSKFKEPGEVSRPLPRRCARRL